MTDIVLRFADFVAAVEIDVNPRFMAALGGVVSALTQAPSARDIQSMRALLQDLERLRDDVGHTSKELASAPLLTDWRFLLAPDGLRLAGKVVGRPVLGARERISTSPVYAVDYNQRAFARTWNRFYRLGAPHSSPMFPTAAQRFH